jgi:hypothetical protein
LNGLRLVGVTNSSTETKAKMFHTGSKTKAKTFHTGSKSKAKTFHTGSKTKAKMFLFGRICNPAVLSICILNAKTMEFCDEARIANPRKRERERGRGRTSPYAKGGKTRLNIPELLSWIKD